MFKIRTLYPDYIKDLDIRYEQLLRKNHEKHFNDRSPEEILTDAQDIVYEALLLVGLRRTADALKMRCGPVGAGDERGEGKE